MAKTSRDYARAAMSEKDKMKDQRNAAIKVSKDSTDVSIKFAEAMKTFRNDIKGYLASILVEDKIPEGVTAEDINTRIKSLVSSAESKADELAKSLEAVVVQRKQIERALV